MSVHKKFQPIRFSRLVGYREHIYECLVLLYRRFVYLYGEDKTLILSNITAKPKILLTKSITIFKPKIQPYNQKFNLFYEYYEHFVRFNITL